MMLGVKGVDSISSNRLLTESGGPLLVRPPIGCCVGRWEDQDMPLGPLLHMVSPSCWESKALALRALHLIAETSCRVFFLLRHEWSLRFHPTTRDRLVEIFVQASFLVH